MSHRVHGEHRRSGEVRRHDRHQCERSRDDDSRRGRSVEHARRPAHAGAHPSAARTRRRRAAARWPHGSGGRPRATRRIAAGRRDLRDPQRDGTTARRPQLEEFCEQHGLTFITDRAARRISTARRNAWCIAWRKRACPPSSASGASWAIETTWTRVSTSRSCTAMSQVRTREALACSCACTRKCLTGDVFHSRRCDCGWQLETAMRMMQAEGKRRHRLSRPGRSRHRPDQQAQGVRTAGPRRRHSRGKRAARLQGRPAQLRHRRADPARHGRAHDSRAHEQPAQARGPRRLRARAARTACGWRRPRTTRTLATSRPSAPSLAIFSQSESFQWLSSQENRAARDDASPSSPAVSTRPSPRRLAEGAVDALVRHGADFDDIDVLLGAGCVGAADGACASALSTGRYDGVVAIGAVIRGETPHFDFVAGEAARGLIGGQSRVRRAGDTRSAHH